MKNEPPEDSQSRKLLDEILERSTDRKRKNVNSLWAFLLKYHQRGGRPFDLTSVARAWEKAGGLQLQSLRNKGGADFRELIVAFATDVGGALVSKSGSKRPGPLEEAIESIADLEMRTVIRIALARDRRNTVENERLRAILRLTKSVDENQVTATRPSISDAPGANGSVAAGVPLHAVALLKKFISTEWIDERRWREDANGTIFDEYNERLTPVGFASEVRELIRTLFAGGGVAD